MLTLILFRKLEIDEIIAQATEHVLFLQHQLNCKEVRLVKARENILQITCFKTFDSTTYIWYMNSQMRQVLTFCSNNI